MWESEIGEYSKNTICSPERKGWFNKVKNGGGGWMPFYDPSLDQVRIWMKSLGLESINKFRETSRLKPIEKLGGLTFEEMKKLGMINEKVYGFFHDGINVFYVEFGKRVII